uniref:hypothetical protein n=1 Tax=uncultured Erythrobacter sp. TaxID=263913 RepID=UPI0026303489|nr:hypothetical protein [uncultured Erythrobacter sp.]
MSEIRLFGPDPIEFLDPAPYSALEYQGHMIAGTVWFVAAIIALFAMKGGKLHIRAGQICVISVLLVALSAVIMLAVEWVNPLFLNSVTATYAVGTAWLALKPGTKRVRGLEYGLSLFEIAGLAVFLSLAIPAVTAGNVPLIGPAIVAALPIILLLGDLNFHSKPDQRAKLRVRRHLARMVWAFVIVLRAPLVEFETGGFYDVPDPLLVAGPPLLGIAMLIYFQRKFGGFEVGKQS